jgi:hypothetical protein
MDDRVIVQCPYCWQGQELEIDPETAGEMVQDCEVCCRPWRVVVTRQRDGELRVRVERAQ